MFVKYVQIVMKIRKRKWVTHHMTSYLFGKGFGFYNNRFKKWQIHAGIGEIFRRAKWATKSTNIGKLDVDSVKFHGQL